MVCGAVPSAEQVERNLSIVCDRRFGGTLVRLAEKELIFRILVAAPVHPDVEASGLGRVVGFRDGDGVGLDGAVERRIVAVDALAFILSPRRVSILQLFGALDAGVEDRESVFDVVGDEEVFGEFEDPLAGLGVDVDIGNKVLVNMFGACGANRGVDFVDLGPDGRHVVRGGVDGGCRLLGVKKSYEEKQNHWIGS
jgi:hypothetical protein